MTSDKHHAKIIHCAKQEKSAPLQCNAAMQYYAMQTVHHIHIHIHITSLLLQVVLIVNVASK